MLQERRLHPRVVIRVPAEVLFAGEAEWDEAMLYDLSAGGAAVHTRRSLADQSEVRLRFRLPADSGGEARRIEVLCLVVRTGAPIARDSLRPFLAGLHFLDLHGEDFDRVRVFVWNRLHPLAST